MSNFSPPPGWQNERPQGPPPSGPPPNQPANPPTGPPTGPHPGQASYGHVPSVNPPQFGGPPQAPTSYGPNSSGQPPYGQGPYGQSPYGQASFGLPPYGPPAKKSRTWLWIVLGLVLVLIAAGGVVAGLMLTGDDDTPKKKAAPDPTPTSAIQGDIDGDGRGDVVYYFQEDYDKVERVTGISTGESFELSELAVDPNTEVETLYLDWDGDGVNEPLSWSFVASGKQITLSSSDDDFPGDQSSNLSLSTLRKYDRLELQLVSGDFDGDGDIDLAVAGQNDRFVDVSVLSNDGAGTFSKPVLWLSIPNAVLDASEFVAGDFDKDGKADLWVELPSERLANKDYRNYYSGDRGYALLTSTGSTFSLGVINKTRIYQNTFLVGDVTGDGTTSIVGVQVDYQDNIHVSVFDVSSGQIKEVPGFTGTSKVGDRSLQSATLSDVDGDGKGDVVFVVKGYDDKKFTGLQVMRSTGAVFDPAVSWAETPVCAETRCRIEFAGHR